MRKFLSAALVLVMLVTLMVPGAMAAEANDGETVAQQVQPAAGAEQGGSNMVANVVVLAIVVLVVGIAIALIIDKKKKLYK